MLHAARSTPLYTSATSFFVMPAAMFCKAQYAFIALIVILGSMQMLSSCGQKGDLYLPQDAPQHVPEERR